MDSALNSGLCRIRVSWKQGLRLCSVSSGSSYLSRLILFPSIFYYLALRNIALSTQGYYTLLFPWNEL